MLGFDDDTGNASHLGESRAITGPLIVEGGGFWPPVAWAIGGGVSGATLLAVTHDHELLPRFDRVVDFLDFHSEGSD